MDMYEFQEVREDGNKTLLLTGVGFTRYYYARMTE